MTPHANESLEDNPQAMQEEEIEPQIVDEEPVDNEYLQLLVDKELGEVGPRFAVPKAVEAFDDREASLKRLLDDQWGPPRFAVPKQTQAMEDEGGEGTSYDAAVAHQVPKVRQAMTLTVIAGPCVGTSYNSSSGPLEIVIGRVPACTFPIPDQEISSKHAVIHYVPADDCWKIVSLSIDYLQQTRSSLFLIFLFHTFPD